MKKFQWDKKTLQKKIQTKVCKFFLFHCKNASCHEKTNIYLDNHQECCWSGKYQGVTLIPWNLSLMTTSASHSSGITTHCPPSVHRIPYAALSKWFGKHFVGEQLPHRHLTANCWKRRLLQAARRCPQVVTRHPAVIKFTQAILKWFVRYHVQWLQHQVRLPGVTTRSVLHRSWPT